VVGSAIKEKVSFIDTSVCLPVPTSKHGSYCHFLTEELNWVVTAHSFPRLLRLFDLVETATSSGFMYLKLQSGRTDTLYYPKCSFYGSWLVEGSN